MLITPLGEGEDVERGLCGRFDDHRAPRGERRAEFERQRGLRVVPRHDQRRNAQGFVPHDGVARAVDIGTFFFFEVRGARDLGVVAQVRDRPHARPRPRNRDRLTDFGGDERGGVEPATLHLVGQLVDPIRALRSGQTRPRAVVERLACRADGAVDVGGDRVGSPPDLAQVDRALDDELGGGGGRDPLAAREDAVARDGASRRGDRGRHDSSVVRVVSDVGCAIPPRMLRPSSRSMYPCPMSSSA